MYKCPLCGSKLSDVHYHRVIKLQARNAKVQKGEVEKLKRQAAEAKRNAQQIRANAARRIDAAKSEAKLAEKKKTQIRMQRMSARIKKLGEENQMLKKHTSPQEVGLADESVLVRRLQKLFPDDDIQHKGKGGDVLHCVTFKKDVVGCIVYECKHTDRISQEHVQQTVLAKKTRQADFAILVTTGVRRGFAGLDQDCGVIVVAQSAVLTLAQICRESLVSMAKQQLDIKEKQAAAVQLMNYVTGPLCRTPLEDAISQAERARKHLVKEVKQHVVGWKKRHEFYTTIEYDVSHVQSNIERVLAGRAPVKLEKPNRKALALPAVAGG